MLERAISQLLMRPARVSAVESLSRHFRFIDFDGEALKNCPWAPGQKIQIKVDTGLVTRTYTPMSWDTSRGATRILAYAHGVGPGSDWVLTIAPGAECRIYGPRPSLGLEDLPPAVILFGDETSFGLAAALQRRAADGRSLHFIFEVTSLAESKPIVDALLVGPVTLIERSPEDAHLAEVEGAMLRLIDASAQFVLSGKAQSIQHVRRALKERGVETRRLRAKVYWSPGKRGLD